MQLVPYLQIRANSIYSFVINEDRDYSKRFLVDASGKSLQSVLYENLQQHATYTGMLRPGSKKRLIKAIDFLVSSTPDKTIYNPVSKRKQPFKLSFITLTVHSPKRNITGKEAHKNLLEPFIKWMRQNYDVRSYIWKAELQRRGQIHYHLTLDNFIHYKQIRAKWNELQQRSGYLDDYFKKKGHYNPNSIDVHSVKKNTNLAGYLIKEIAKSFQNEKSIGGKIWDCSMNLKACKFFTIHENMDYAWVNHMVKEKQMRVIETDHCYIYEMLSSPAHHILNPTQLQEYNQYMSDVRNGVQTIPKVKTEPVFIHPNVIPLSIVKQEKDLFYKEIPIDFDIDIGCFSSS